MNNERAPLGRESRNLSYSHSGGTSTVIFKMSFSIANASLMMERALLAEGR